MDQPLNPKVYPRTYRTSGRSLWESVLLSLFFSIPGLGLFWVVFSSGGDFYVSLFVLGCGLLILATLPVVCALKLKVVLDANRIEAQGLFPGRDCFRVSKGSLLRSQIQGRRVARNSNGWRSGSTWLIPRGEENGENAENKITMSNRPGSGLRTAGVDRFTAGSGRSGAACL